jgi:hypothetical protein
MSRRRSAPWVFASLSLLGACGPMQPAEPPSESVAYAASRPSVATAGPPPTLPTATELPASPGVPSSVPPVATAPSPQAEPDEEDGPLDFEEQGDLERGQREVLRIVGRCYLRALERGEQSTGALFVQVSLDPSGKVQDVTLADGFSGRVKACAEPRLREVQFAPGSGRLGVLRFPINELSAEETAPPQ